MVAVKFRNFHTVSVEKREFHCHAKFFSSNQLRVNFFSKKLISRNFCENMVAVKSRNFQNRDYGLKRNYRISILQLQPPIQWNQLKRSPSINVFTKELISRKFFHDNVLFYSTFRNFHVWKVSRFRNTVSRNIVQLHKHAFNIEIFSFTNVFNEQLLIYKKSEKSRYLGI